MNGNEALRRTRRAVGKAQRRVLSSRLYAARQQRQEAAFQPGAGLPPENIGAWTAPVLADLRANFLAKVDMTTIIPPAIGERALQLCQSLRTVPPRSSEIVAEMDDVVADFSVWEWGVSNTNLDMIEWYLGVPVRYLGVGLKRECADDTFVGARQWHVDIEDRHMLKLIVYLNDVDAGTGPFEYLDRDTTSRVRSALNYSSGFVVESEVVAVTEPGEWKQVVGPRFTGVLADTSNLFHRAQPPRTNDRYSMTFSYCSAKPYQVLREFLPNRAQAKVLRARLGPRQRAAAHLF